MSFIEGIGDEVVQFFALLLLVFLGIIAWWSTYISDAPHIRTVVIVERRSQNVTTQQPNLLSQRPDRLTAAQGTGGLCQQQTVTVNNDNKSEIPKNNKEKVDNEVIVNNEIPQASNSASADNIGSTISDSLPSSDSPVETNDNQEESNDSSNDVDTIRIRLKYLNDDQKLVEGRLQELLGDFKRRHFRIEMSAQRLVRLIFNGQVLQRDEETLTGCGLYDNCVVHCLVSQAGQTATGRGSRLNTPPPDWNLGGLLYVCLSLALGLAWICRYNYAHLFTLTTTTALVGLTGMFAVSIIGIYMHDQETQATTN